VSTFASGEAEHLTLERCHSGASSVRRWSRQGSCVPKRLTPPAGPPPTVPAGVGASSPAASPSATPARPHFTHHSPAPALSDNTAATRRSAVERRSLHRSRRPRRRRWAGRAALARARGCLAAQASPPPSSSYARCISTRATADERVHRPISTVTEASQESDSARVSRFSAATAPSDTNDGGGGASEMAATVTAAGPMLTRVRRESRGTWTRRRREWWTGTQRRGRAATRRREARVRGTRGTRAHGRGRGVQAEQGLRGSGTEGSSGAASVGGSRSGSRSGSELDCQSSIESIGGLMLSGAGFLTKSATDDNETPPAPPPVALEGVSYGDSDVASGGMFLNNCGDGSVFERTLPDGSVCLCCLPSQ
jgi:hypothetical protein